MASFRSPPPPARPSSRWASLTASRTPSAVGATHDKPLVAADRGRHSTGGWASTRRFVDAENQVDESAAYIDPNDLANYYSISLPKPMGIAFVENDGEVRGVYVDQVLAEGSASSEKAPLVKYDQLVGVDTSSVHGADFDTALDTTAAASGEKHASSASSASEHHAFLGPTQPTAEWSASTLLAAPTPPEPPAPEPSPSPLRRRSPEQGGQGVEPNAPLMQSDRIPVSECDAADFSVNNITITRSTHESLLHSLA